MGSAQSGQRRKEKNKNKGERDEVDDGLSRKRRKKKKLTHNYVIIRAKVGNRKRGSFLELVSR